MTERARAVALAGLAAIPAALIALAEPAPARGAGGGSEAGGMVVHGSTAYVPGEVVVKVRGDRDRTVRLPEGVGVRRAARALRQRSAVQYAAPNHIARASAFLPGDPGGLREPRGDPPDDLEESIGPDSAPEAGEAGGWMSRQWNFLPWRPDGSLPSSAGGIDAVGGWQNLISARRPGARGVTVAVVDTGLAYRGVGRRYRRNPDFQPWQFTRGYDFVRDNRWPLDRNGHGTHIAGTIGQQTDNEVGLTGLAYNARLMPIRVLDVHGNGTSDRIADGIRWAADRGADVINMSFNFGCDDRVPNVEDAIKHAYRQGAVLVASVGNAHAERCISAPAGLSSVIGVGASTEGGCLGSYSLTGPGLDLVAPGGGRPVTGFDCGSTGTRPIYQLTFRRPGDRRRFGVPSRYFGTSMAAAHVSGAAAMVLASGTAGRAPSPRAVRQRLLRTARHSTSMPRLPGFGAGIVDVGAATDRRQGPRPGLLRP